MDFVGSATRVWIFPQFVLTVYFWPSVETRKESATVLRMRLGFDHAHVKLSNS